MLHIYYSLLPLFIRRQNGFAWFFSLFFYSLNCHFLVFNAVVFRVLPPINGAEINQKIYYSIAIKFREPLLMQASSYHPWLRHDLSFYSSSLIIILGQIFFQPKVFRETVLAKAQQTTIYDLQFPEHFFRPIYCSCFCSSTTYLHMKRAFVLLNFLAYQALVYRVQSRPIHFFVNQLKTRIFH